MIPIKKIENSIDIDQELIQRFCQYEKNILLQIIPDEEFFSYILSYNKIYKVTCSYRGNILFKYIIYNLNDLQDIKDYLLQICELLCRIICNQVKNDIISSREEEFIIHILSNYSRNNCTYMILNHYPYFSNRIQSLIKSIMTYL